MKKAVIYARYSSHSQRDESIEGQLRECHDYANKNDYLIVEEYCDKALTGKTDARAAFQKMIKDAKNNKFNYVLVYKLDRFARNRYDSAMYKNILKKHNVKVISIMENISDSPEGIILESVLEGMAEYYSANLSQNIKRGMTENALQCKFNGSGVPVGYKITPDKQFEIDPHGAQIVREIYELYASGRTIGDIIKYCNAKDYTTSKGTPFRHTPLNKILTNEKYIGTYRHADIVIPNGIPAIIDKELFDKVQQKMKANYKTRARGTAKTTYLLSTKAFCGHCGALLNGISGTSRWGNSHYYYRCGAKKRGSDCTKSNELRDWLENTVVQILVEQVLTDENIELIADKVVELVAQEAADDTLVKYYEEELKETQKKMKNLMDAMEVGGRVSKKILDRIDELEEYEKSITENLEIEKMKTPTISKPQIIYWLESFRYGDIDDINYKQRLIDTLLHSVYVYDLEPDDEGKSRKRLVLNFNTSSNNTAEVTVFDHCTLSSTKLSVVKPLMVINYSVFAYVIEITV